MAAVKKAAPDPMLSAGWQDGDPAPVVMQNGARHRPVPQGENVTRFAAERREECENFPESAATPPRRGGRNWKAALDQADRIRLARAALRRKVVAGEVQLSDLVFAASEIEAIRTAAVFDVLRWKPHVGYTRARKLIANVAGETTTFGAFGAFSETTRSRLVDRLVEMER